MPLVKHRTIMHLHPDQRSGKFHYFEPLWDEGEEKPDGYYMPNDQFAEMGLPTQITVTVQPGDHLNGVRTYTKKPVDVEALEWTGTVESAQDVIQWILDGGGTANYQCLDPGPCTGEETRHVIAIQTLEGTMLADRGDFIIRGVEGEFYPCKPDIFAKTYSTKE